MTADKPSPSVPGLRVIGSQNHAAATWQARTLILLVFCLGEARGAMNRLGGSSDLIVDVGYPRQGVPYVSESPACICRRSNPRYGRPGTDRRLGPWLGLARRVPPPLVGTGIRLW